MQILRDFYVGNKEKALPLDIERYSKAGKNVIDYICPESMQFFNKYFTMGEKYGRAIYLKDYAAYISDKIVMDITDLPKNMMYSMSVVPMATDVAIKYLETVKLGLEKNLTDWQNNQNKNNNFSATPPSQITDPIKAITELIDDIKNRDQHLMFVNVSTNRDANHIAISEDDGKTWIGFRELYLNNIRNYADFRSIGGVNSRDKSVHQAQILELPFNKVLVHFGQNSIARKIVIFDVNWLYEKEREENFKFGLQNVSTQMYIKSNLGGYRGFSGHCAYNRTDGALLIPDPDGNFQEVLQVARVEDDRLVYKKQGVVWNFPSSDKGKIEIMLRVLESGVAVSLTDRWYNPCDETASKQAYISFSFTEKTDCWCKIHVEYDMLKRTADVFVDGALKTSMELKDVPANGLSYLHIQTLAENMDMKGTIIKYFKKTL